MDSCYSKALPIQSNKNRLNFLEVYLEHSQRSKTKRFVKIVYGFASLTIFVKSYVLGVWLGSEYTSGNINYFRKRLHIRCLVCTNIVFVGAKPWIKIYGMTADKRCSWRKIHWKSYIPSKIHDRIILSQWRRSNCKVPVRESFLNTLQAKTKNWFLRNFRGKLF